MGIVKRINYNPDMTGMAEIINDVVFSQAGGEELKLQLILPWWDRLCSEPPKYPFVVFIQGSGWTFPNVWYEIPQLCELAKRGIAVASITHRNSLEGYPFPACLQDVKTALRYLRANAEVYGLDAGRAGIWGTSSGGNLALLAAMTAGDSRYTTGEYEEYSDSVNFCVSCFPPTDLAESMRDETFDEGIKQTFIALSGGSIDETMTVLKEMSPYHIARRCLDKRESGTAGQICEAGSYPPVFMAHGDADMLIPYSQSTKLYEVLDRLEGEVTFVTVENGPHEGTFWSRELFEMIFKFIEEHI